MCPEILRVSVDAKVKSIKPDHSVCDGFSVQWQVSLGELGKEKAKIKQEVM